VPFNIASYSFLTYIIAHLCDLEAHEFIYHLGNCHIYDDHLEVLKEQSTRSPHPFPTIQISGNQKTIEEYQFTDIQISDYQYHPPISMEMRK
jgi:thymidylate synthase